ncbi:hypothetical protein HYU06_07220 [Candidatus Woesearchaeota archaeon]|nr:hypothetical protein [Candidatus Woesearchaeota archaeon]
MENIFYKKRGHIFIAIFIFLFILSSNVLALGISPAITEVSFSPGLSENVELSIAGEAKPFDINVISIGELAEFVHLTATQLTVPPQGLAISYNFTLPMQLTPGRHKASIVVEQKTPVQESGAGKPMFGATPAVGHVLAVDVPYEAKYAMITVEATNANIGEIVNLKVIINNLGNEDISLAKSVIGIFDNENKKIISIETDSKGVPKGEKAELYAYWTPKNISPGVYTAKAGVDYDGKSTEAESTFRIGDLSISIIDLSPKEFEIDSITKVKIDIESFWSSKIPSAYAIVTISKDSKDYFTTKTPSVDLGPLVKTQLEAYLDTHGLTEGEYDANIKLRYSDKQTDKKVKIRVTKIKKIEGPGTSIVTIVVAIAVIVLIILAIYIFIKYYLKREK